MQDEAIRPGPLMPAAGPPPRMRVASSLERAAVGQTLVVGGRGEIVGPGHLRRLSATGWLITGTATGAMAVLYGSLFGGPVAILAVALCGGLIGWRMRHMPALRAAAALISAGRRDEAHAALLDLERRRLTALQRDTVDTLLAGTTWLRGEHDEALARYDRALARLRWRRAGTARTNLWLCTFAKAELLAAMGRVNDARRVQAELEGAPHGDLFEMLRQAVALTIAFAADAPDELPDDDTLHDWARAALGRTRFGGMLVALSWAFSRRGDEDMARHLLAEAPSRLEGMFLAETAPRLHAWMVERTADWDLAG